MAKTRTADAEAIRGRRAKAHQFMQAAADAVKMLKTVNKTAANHLQTLISIKSKSAYTPLSSSGTDRTKAERAAQHLMGHLT